MWWGYDDKAKPEQGEDRASQPTGKRGLLLEILKHTEESYRGEGTESLVDVEVRLVGIVNHQWNRCLIY